jgi:hypothetical protein
MLTWTNSTDYLPAWVKDVYGIADPYPAPEYPNMAALFIAIFAITLVIVTLRRTLRQRKGLPSNRRALGHR